jgi:ubiquinone/menaquinone biosynthesis C-methylase UbiE
MLSGLPQNGPTDPIEYYRRPLVGRLFRERVNRGLRLLGSRRFARALEVGYGAGALQIALAPAVDELFGIDLDADPGPVRELLATRGLRSELAKGSVLALPHADATFDLVFCFSVIEHLREYPKALSEMRRVLRPRALLLLGMPAVNKVMDAGFFAIGFKRIDDHHVTTPAEVVRGFAAAGFRELAHHHLDVPARSPFGVRLYNNWLLEAV